MKNKGGKFLARSLGRLFVAGMLGVAMLSGLHLALLTQTAKAQVLIDASKGASALGSVKLAKNFGSPASIISLVFDIVIGASMAIFVILLLAGGIRYLVAGGNEEATSGAKKLLLDAIIGLVITLSAWAIGVFILSQLGYSLSGGGGGNLPKTPQGPTGPPTSTPGNNQGKTLKSFPNSFVNLELSYNDANSDSQFTAGERLMLNYQLISGNANTCKNSNAKQFCSVEMRIYQPPTADTKNILVNKSNPVSAQNPTGSLDYNITSSGGTLIKLGIVMMNLNPGMSNATLWEGEYTLNVHSPSASASSPSSSAQTPSTPTQTTNTNSISLVIKPEKIVYIGDELQFSWTIENFTRDNYFPEVKIAEILDNGDYKEWQTQQYSGDNPTMDSITIPTKTLSEGKEYRWIFQVLTKKKDDSSVVFSKIGTFSLQSRSN